jgi:AcrR family transcriptional regulator
MDEIAGLARAGKLTIYARFPTKKALFTAVVMRSVADKIARFEAYEPTGETIEERLASVGETVLRWVFAGDTIGLMRLAIAEARRFPELARSSKRCAPRSSRISRGQWRFSRRVPRWRAGLMGPATLQPRA